MKHYPPHGERANTLTHLAGAILPLASIKLLILAIPHGWPMVLGIALFLIGMEMMFLSSTLYHWATPGAQKKALRHFDHISIYVMIAGSYSPICIGIVGGALGWTAFAILWVCTLGGVVYKLLALGRWPRLSLALYLMMGWSGILIAKPVIEALPAASLWLLLVEGLFYTAGTWFYARDNRPGYHAIWHVFVLLGAIAQLGSVICFL